MLTAERVVRLPLKFLLSLGGALRIRRRRLGGRSVGGGVGSGASRLYRVSQGDEVDVESAQFFVNSSLAPVLLIRRRLKSVEDVKGSGHAGVGVVSLGGAQLTLPTFATPELQEFFRMGRALRVILPTGEGRVIHLFVVYGYQGSGGGF